MSAAGPPLVSVVVPTYNRADYLAETVESVLAQDHPALEVVVVDDGSTDATPKLLAGYEGQPQVRPLRQPNRGQSRAVNAGLAAARGEYLALVSDDDPLLPGAVPRLVEALEADDELLAVYPDWAVIDEGGARRSVVTQLEWSLRDALRLHVCMPGPGTLFRRRALEATGGWDTRWRWVADYDFWLRVGLLGPLARVPEVLATWRSHTGSATVGGVDRSALAAEQHLVVEAFLERPDLPAELAEVKAEALRNAYIVAAGIVHAPPLGVTERFAVEDRLAAVLNHRVRPEASGLVDEADTIRWLHGELARRDRELRQARLRAEVLEERARLLERRVELAEATAADAEARAGGGDGC